MRDDELESYLTAHHESGHAVIAGVLIGRRRCGGAAILVGDPYRSGYATVHASDADVRTQILISLAGGIAEQRIIRRFGDPTLTVADHADHFDRQRIRRLAIDHCVNKFELDTLRIRARRLVREHWGAVKRVASALYRNGMLEGREIDKLVRQQ